MKLLKTISVLIFIFLSQTYSNEKNKFIRWGIDTLNSYSWQGYFDFVSQRPCTSEADYNTQQFEEHIKLSWDTPPKYKLLVYAPDGPCFKDYGKTNLDSIKMAPPDSELIDNNGGGLYNVFNVRPDSLKSLICTSYVIKTRKDPRYDRPFYAKIRVLYFNVIDSANYKVEMKFLWVYQTSGSPELQTSGVDTFDFPVTISSNFQRPVNSNIKNQTIYKVFGNRLTIPENLVGKVRYAEVFDLMGRLVAVIELKGRSQIVFFKSVKNRGSLFIVRFKS